MASSTNKRVLIVRFDREPVSGVVNPAVLFQDGVLEVLGHGGNLITVSVQETKAVCFVKDLPPSESWKPNRFFTVRPKMEGLWLRLRFRDDDAMDGVAPNNLLLVDPLGFQIIPPDPAFLNQRIFVPRQALVETQVLGVIGSPLRRTGASTPARKKPATLPGQISLFDSETA